MKEDSRSVANPESRTDPMVELMFLRQMILQKGNNDFESSQVDGVIEQYRVGEIEAEQAITELENILNSKQR